MLSCVEWIQICFGRCLFHTCWVWHVTLDNFQSVGLSRMLGLPCHVSGSVNCLFAYQQWGILRGKCGRHKLGLSSINTAMVSSYTRLHKVTFQSYTCMMVTLRTMSSVTFPAVPLFLSNFLWQVCETEADAKFCAALHGRISVWHNIHIQPSSNRYKILCATPKLPSFFLLGNTPQKQKDALLIFGITG